MCLQNISERKIAGEDITCYKYLKTAQRISSNVKHGDDFTCKIKGIAVTGKISIDNNIVYFCTNELKANGKACTEKFGYKYSWIWDGDVSDFKDIISVLITPFQEVEVEIGKTYFSDLFPTQLNPTILCKGLHSITDLNDCIENTGINNVVVKCIIPKGSEYYEGMWWDYKGYASNCIKYVEIINT